MRVALLVVCACVAGCSALADGERSTTAPGGDGAAAGAVLFQQYCASCHGRFGEGDGPVAPALSVVMQDLRYLARRNGGVFSRETVRGIVDGRDSPTAHGGREMPVWGIAFRPDGDDTPEADQAAAAKIDALIDYLGAVQVRE
jgi:mono/diheme cytochrome c family protein